VSKKPRSIAFYVYTGSVIFHVALVLGAIVLPKQKRDETIAITLAEEKKKRDPPKPPPPPPTPPPAEKPKPKAAAQPQAQAKVAPTEVKPAEVAPPLPVGADGFADLGMSLGNSDGPGIAIPAAVAAAAATAAATAKATPVKKVQQLVAPTEGADVCNDPVVRPKRKVPVAPKYTMQARQAEIEGVVRVEVTVDESGHVLSARVLSGLGYGLDESALAAAKATTFEPATRCGKPIVGTTVLPFRFEQT
jgi:protein TonB